MADKLDEYLKYQRKRMRFHIKLEKKFQIKQRIKS